ncbi:MAG: hypothetical protein GX606_06430 [Elusimicrobia bacterium]|nr:hypothetical protein [Elusimicrobiota bacterium]
MRSEGQTLTIVGVDKAGIVPGTGKQDAWFIPFKLSRKPDEVWEKKFAEAQGMDRDLMKRKAQIIEDVIRVEVLEADDIQRVLEVIKRQVAEANALCEKDYQKKMRVREELETLQARQDSVTQKIREAADRLNF